jgi:hypothetical protein
LRISEGMTAKNNSKYAGALIILKDKDAMEYNDFPSVLISLKYSFQVRYTNKTGTFNIF